MPNKSDIILAVKNSDKFLKITDLHGAKVKLKSDGSPYFYTGGFTMVFQLEKNSKKWAFRVWHTNIQNVKERFRKISQYLLQQRLPYFAEFIYDEKGLLVNGENVDTIRMEWLDGLLLKEYIEQKLHDKKRLLKLAEDFLIMSKDLHSNRISHGDLQHGNIIIKKGNIRLIDYDSVCVPEIEGEDEYVTGLKGYQHPSRIGSITKSSLKADYFSELIIYLSILAIAENPKLWDEFQVRDSEYLLFNEDDFVNFEQSKIHMELSTNSSQTVKDLVNILIQYINKLSYLDLDPFDKYLNPPEIVRFSADKNVILSGQRIELSWEITNAHEVAINNGIGKVNCKDKKDIVLLQSTIYILTAKNSFGITEKETVIRLFPTPIIESLKVPMPDFATRFSLSSVNIASPNINVSINLSNFNFILPQFTKPEVELSKIKPLYKTNLMFNLSKLYEYVRKEYVRKEKA
jgi:serine/threonine protein kinase